MTGQQNQQQTQAIQQSSEQAYVALFQTVLGSNADWTPQRAQQAFIDLGTKQNTPDGGILQGMIRQLCAQQAQQVGIPPQVVQQSQGSQS